MGIIYDFLGRPIGSTAGEDKRLVGEKLVPIEETKTITGVSRPSGGIVTVSTRPPTPEPAPTPETKPATFTRTAPEPTTAPKPDPVLPPSSPEEQKERISAVFQATGELSAAVQEAYAPTEKELVGMKKKLGDRYVMFRGKRMKISEVQKIIKTEKQEAVSTGLTGLEKKLFIELARSRDVPIKFVEGKPVVGKEKPTGFLPKWEKKEEVDLLGEFTGIGKRPAVGINIPKSELFVGASERLKEVAEDKEEREKLIFQAVGFGVLGGLGAGAWRYGGLPGKLASVAAVDLMGMLALEPLAEATTYFFDPTISGKEKIRTAGKIQFDLGVMLPITVATEGIIGTGFTAVATTRSHILDAPKGEIFDLKKSEILTPKEMFAESLELMRPKRPSRTELSTTKIVDDVGISKTKITETLGEGTFTGERVAAISKTTEPGVTQIRMLELESPLVGRFSDLTRTYKVAGAEITVFEKLGPTGAIIERTQIGTGFKAEVTPPRPTPDLIKGIETPIIGRVSETLPSLEKMSHTFGIEASRIHTKFLDVYEAGLPKGYDPLRIIPPEKVSGVLNIFAKPEARPGYVKLDPFIKGFVEIPTTSPGVRIIPQIKRADLGVIEALYAPSTSALLLEPYKATKPIVKSAIPKLKTDALPVSRPYPTGEGVIKIELPKLAGMVGPVTEKRPSIKVEEVSTRMETVFKLKPPVVSSKHGLIQIQIPKTETKQIIDQKQIQSQMQIRKQAQKQLTAQIGVLETIQVTSQIPKLKLDIGKISISKVEEKVTPVPLLKLDDLLEKPRRKRRKQPKSLLPKLPPFKLRVKKPKTKYKADIGAAVTGFKAAKIPKFAQIGPGPRPLIRRKPKKKRRKK